jgi:hypothetical protein
MKISGRWLRRQISGCLLLVLVAPFMPAAALPQQATNSSQNAESVSSARTQSKESDSGNNKKLNAEVSQTETLPESPGTVHSRTIAENPPGSGQQPSPQQQQSGTQEPVGTAASGSVKATGVAASQPAGAAIAPAKQRRTRSILIKVGALVGVGVAVGTVVALSSASPSRPR